MLQIKPKPKLSILICNDCYYFYHYGADSFNNETNNEKNILLAWSSKRWRKYRYNFMRPSMELLQIHDFFKTPCKICKSDLAGARFEMELTNA